MIVIKDQLTSKDVTLEVKCLGPPKRPIICSIQKLETGKAEENLGQCEASSFSEWCRLPFLNQSDANVHPVLIGGQKV